MQRGSSLKRQSVGCCHVEPSVDNQRGAELFAIRPNSKGVHRCVYLSLRLPSSS